MNDCDIVDKNIDSVSCPLTPKEEEVLRHIRQTFFIPLSKPHWEDIEVSEYRKTLNNL